MVDREHDLGKQDQQTGQGFEVPQQRRSEIPPQQQGIRDEVLRTYFPPGNYEFERAQLEVTGSGVEEVGIWGTGERIEAYQLGSDGKRKALRGVLTGYHGVFRGKGLPESISVSAVAIITGSDASTEFFTDMPEMDVYRRAQKVAKKNIPISIARSKRTGTVLLVSRTPAGLISDINYLEATLGRFSRRDRVTLQRARIVAEHIRNNFKIEIPPDQPGRVKVRGQ